MKCLSLWQPWATLIAIGAKSIETRSWPTKYRGPLAIHAAKKWNYELNLMCFGNPIREALQKADYDAFCGDWQEARWQEESASLALPLGKIVAVVDLVECYEVKEQWLKLPSMGGCDGIPLPVGNERAFGDYAPGRYAWKLANIRRLEAPIPCIGHQGIFNVPDIDPELLKGGTDAAHSPTH